MVHKLLVNEVKQQRFKQARILGGVPHYRKTTFHVTTTDDIISIPNRDSFKASDHRLA